MSLVRSKQTGEPVDTSMMLEVRISRGRLWKLNIGCETMSANDLIKVKNELTLAISTPALQLNETYHLERNLLEKVNKLLNMKSFRKLT